MNDELILQYDREGDILYLYRCPPYAEQETEHLEDDILVRLNPNTDEVEAIEVLFFSQRLQDSSQLSLPILAKLERALPKC